MNKKFLFCVLASINMGCLQSAENQKNVPNGTLPLRLSEARVDALLADLNAENQKNGTPPSFEKMMDVLLADLNTKNHNNHVPNGTAHLPAFDEEVDAILADIDAENQKGHRQNGPFPWPDFDEMIEGVIRAFVDIPDINEEWLVEFCGELEKARQLNLAGFIEFIRKQRTPATFRLMHTHINWQHMGQRELIDYETKGCLYDECIVGWLKQLLLDSKGSAKNFFNEKQRHGELAQAINAALSVVDAPYCELIPVMQENLGCEEFSIDTCHSLLRALRYEHSALAYYCKASDMEYCGFCKRTLGYQQRFIKLHDGVRFACGHLLDQFKEQRIKVKAADNTQKSLEEHYGKIHLQMLPGVAVPPPAWRILFDLCFARSLQAAVQAINTAPDLWTINTVSNFLHCQCEPLELPLHSFLQNVVANRKHMVGLERCFEESVESCIAELVGMFFLEGSINPDCLVPSYKKADYLDVVSEKYGHIEHGDYYPERTELCLKFLKRWHILPLLMSQDPQKNYFARLPGDMVDKEFRGFYLYAMASEKRQMLVFERPHPVKEISRAVVAHERREEKKTVLEKEILAERKMSLDAGSEIL
jgi:hypothetical protein